jgi:undecaprenyl-diphosphatase
VNDLDARLFRLLYCGERGNNEYGGALMLVMLAFTALGSGWVALSLVPLGAWPRTRRHLFGRPGAALAIAIAAQSLLVFGMKRLNGRTRPWIALALPTDRALPHDFSFPSGHATASFTVAAFLAVLAVASPPSGATQSRWRHVLGASALVVAGLISVSRVFLGAHWPSDVLGGALLGTLIGVVAARVARV